jgi:hypothetical protein
MLGSSRQLAVHGYVAKVGGDTNGLGTTETVPAGDADAREADCEGELCAVAAARELAACRNEAPVPSREIDPATPSATSAATARMGATVRSPTLFTAQMLAHHYHLQRGFGAICELLA